MLKLNRTEMFTAEDCKSNVDDWTNKLVILRDSALSAEYQKPEYQLLLATDGFGCKADAIGNAVYGTLLVDKEHARWERYQIYGVANDEVIKEVLDNNTLELKDYLRILNSIDSVSYKVKCLYQLSSKYELSSSVEDLLSIIVTSDYVTEYIAYLLQNGDTWMSIRNHLIGMTGYTEEYFIQEQDENFTMATSNILDNLISDILSEL